MGIKDQKNMDNGYEKLIKDLKNLPKVDAPDNFEYNLMIKIQNGEFDSKEAKSDSSKLWGFIPATAVALSIMIIFFVVKETSVEVDNPYLNELDQSAQIADNIPDTVNLRGPANSDKLEDSYVVIHPNDVIKKEKSARPRIPLNGVSVDNFIDGSRRNTTRGGNTHTVGRANRFDGFLAEVEPDRKEIAKLRARMDSLKAEAKKNQK